MMFFMFSLLKPSVVGNKPLYWLLISTFIYTFFKILYEWYHYWDIGIRPLPPITKQYTVDIFTTFCAGEPYEMMVETLTAIQAITYPHETYLCDEADDPYLKEVCRKLGIHHVTRTIKIDAKAGNINNALQQSSGDLCVVLDPDHIPVPGFLDSIVSHFDDEEIGYVQIVQAYYNQDTGWIAKGAAQQTYQFYGPMMMCMDSYGTVQAIGANCTFRRTALNSIGGHAAGLAEDMHTAMQLHAKKWKSLYVPEVLTKGLVPATLSAYYKQQLKWSRGVFELLVTSYVKLFKNFTWRQKLHYGLLPLFYLSGFIFLINFLIPVISLFADVYPLRMDLDVFLIAGTPLITAVVLIRHYVQQWVMGDDERGFHIVGGLLLIGTWWVFILGFIYTIIRKDVPYIATPKDVRDEKNFKNNLPNIIVLLVSITAIIYGLYNDWNPFTFSMAGITALNCLFMLFILIASSELKLNAYLKRYPNIHKIALLLKSIRRSLWIFRRKMYTGMRSISLMLLVFAICFILYIATNWDKERDNTTPAGMTVLKPLTPEPGQNSLLNYTALNADSIKKIMEQEPLLAARNKSALVIRPDSGVDSILTQKIPLPAASSFLSSRGVIYLKGSYWYKNLFVLNKKTIDNDFSAIRSAGINTVKIYGPNIYNYLILAGARKQKLKIAYSFWLPDPSVYINNSDKLNELAKIIIETVNKNKKNPDISAWNLGNTGFQQLVYYYNKPQLFYAQGAYIKWLKRLIANIKIADTQRPVTMDVLANATLSETINLLHKQIPQLSAFGIIVNNKLAVQNIPDSLNAPYFYSSIDPGVVTTDSLPIGGAFYASWQDQQAESTITFNGLKDIWGHNKPALYQISKNWGGKIPANNLPPLKILRPALTAIAGSAINYSALVYINNEWKLAFNENTGLYYNWYLVKTDNWGNNIDIKKIGNGPAVSVLIPPNMLTYKLYVVASEGNNVTDASSILNIPLGKSTLPNGGQKVKEKANNL